MKETVIGVIGGSGVYEIEELKHSIWQHVDTPWGPPAEEVVTGSL